jgi:hypothetical protein
MSQVAATTALTDRHPTGPGLQRLHDDLHNEYARLVDIVSSFDQRLLVIKGWGVTLSLASLGLGFQQEHYGLFLVAAVSGLAFWLLEATTKMHQIRYYPRMGDIEFTAYTLFHVDTADGPASSPLIDWGWYTAYPRVRRSPSKGDPRVPKPWPDAQQGRRMRPWLYAHVAFPHLVAVIVGIVLFVLGLAGVFGSI